MAILLRIVLACSMLIPAIPQEESAGKKKGPVRIEESGDKPFAVFNADIQVATGPLRMSVK